MKDTFKEVIKAMCDCDMNIQKVANTVYKTRGTILYHCDKIKEEYGLDPRRFHDLVILEQMVDEKSQEERNEVINEVINEIINAKKQRLCIQCGKILIGQRRKYCSKECQKAYYKGSKYWGKVSKKWRAKNTNKCTCLIS